MSGLLATLLAAAQGKAAVATHRPHARFEPSTFAPDDIEWRDPIEAPPALDRADGAAPPPRASTSDAPATAPTPAHAPSRRTPTAAPLLLTDSERRPARATAPIAAPPFPVPQPRKATGTAPPQPSQADAERAAGRAPQAVADPMERDDARLLPQAATESRAAQFRPSLPLQEPTPGPPNNPAPIALATEAARTVLEDTAGFILRIGRIEVRAAPLAPAAPAPAPHPVATRPVALPRAMVRQSLDDYRTSRKR